MAARQSSVDSGSLLTMASRWTAVGSTAASARAARRAIHPDPGRKSSSARHRIRSRAKANANDIARTPSGPRPSIFSRAPSV